MEHVDNHSGCPDNSVPPAQPQALLLPSAPYYCTRQSTRPSAMPCTMCTICTTSFLYVCASLFCILPHTVTFAQNIKCAMSIFSLKTFYSLHYAHCIMFTVYKGLSIVCKCMCIVVPSLALLSRCSLSCFSCAKFMTCVQECKTVHSWALGPPRTSVPSRQLAIPQLTAFVAAAAGDS